MKNNDPWSYLDDRTPETLCSARLEAGRSPESRRSFSIAATTGEHATLTGQRASTGPRSSSQWRRMLKRPE
jgi:hypothetical protein